MKLTYVDKTSAFLQLDSDSVSCLYFNYSIILRKRLIQKCKNFCCDSAIGDDCYKLYILSLLNTSVSSISGVCPTRRAILKKSGTITKKTFPEENTEKTLSDKNHSNDFLVFQGNRNESENK